MDARPTIGFARTAATLALLAAAAAVVLPGLADARSLTLGRAERAARQAVVQDPSYRGIAGGRSTLRTRACWRAHGSKVRCALYVVVPSPCALDDGAEVCAQALWERRWLVQITRKRDGALAVRILKISAGPSEAGPSAARRLS